MGEFVVIMLTERVMKECLLTWGLLFTLIHGREYVQQCPVPLYGLSRAKYTTTDINRPRLLRQPQIIPGRSLKYRAPERLEPGLLPWGVQRSIN